MGSGPVVGGHPSPGTCAGVDESRSHIPIFTLQPSTPARSPILLPAALTNRSRLNAQSLDLATSLQLDRARGRAYYGMGVAYYGIGDRDLAARFLRSSLEILTADVDARGRVSALRSLAVLEHETGDLAQASAHNSEALRLATAPSARSRIISAARGGLPRAEADGCSPGHAQPLLAQAGIRWFRRWRALSAARSTSLPATWTLRVGTWSSPCPRFVLTKL